MTRMLKLLGSASMLPVAILGASPAFAAGTTQGTSIQNTVSVNYTVGGVNQTPVNSNTDAFQVDRVVRFTVVEDTSGTRGGNTAVSPGQNGAVTFFVVTNTTNDAIDINLAATEFTDANNIHTFPSGSVFVESGANAGYQAAEDTAVFIDDLAADASRVVYVIGNIVGSASNGQTAAVRLTGTAHVGGAAGLGTIYSTSGVGAALISTDATANTAAVQTIFGDGTTGGNTARDGIHFANDGYIVSAATLTVFKTSRVISDPVSSTNPKAIPGAVVEYCISVANSAGSATAQGLSIGDVIPANTTYAAGTIRVNATVASPGASQTCTGGTARTDVVDTPTDDGGSFNSGTNTVNGTLTDVAGGAANALIFRVTIN
jgi:uncharacterized repeat protein (TIGR01451 family)